MRFILPFMVALCGVELAGCTNRAGPPPASVAAPGSPWLSAHHREHRLAGRIWDVRRSRFGSPETMIAALRAAPFVLLGEKHDNPDHHRMQAWIVQALVASGRRPAVAFEMLDSDQDERLSGFLADRPGKADDLGRAVGWDRSGWPDWAIYRSIAQSALDGGLPIVSANLPRRQVRDIARDGAGALDAATVKSLGLDGTLPAEMTSRMRQEIVASHCGHISDAMAAPLVTAQILRDAHMARAMKDAAGIGGVDGALLIAGTRHVRADRGVPWHLRRMEPGRDVATVGLIEISEGEFDPAAYGKRFDGLGLPFDYVWFAPRADLTDPCEKYGKNLRRAGKDRRRHPGD